MEDLHVNPLEENEIHNLYKIPSMEGNPSKL